MPNLIRQLLALLTLAASAVAAEPARPNIIFILTDDQGYGDLSCHGNPILKTPNLDRFHDEAVRFTDFHVSPTCAPTRAALNTGRHEFRNGVTHTIYERERLTLKATTLAQVLQGAGYTTGIFGKWHLGDEAKYQPNRRGFDEVFIHGGGGIGQTFPGSCGDAPGNTYFSPAILHNGKFEKTQGYCTDVFFEQALKWIGSVKGKRPFYAYIACNAPHTPLQVPEEYEQQYAGKVGTNVAKFFGMIANIDDNVGRLLARLKDLGIERDTLVVFMNDNGGTAGMRVFNAGMRGGKLAPWLGGTRAASFWRWPGTFKPADVAALAAHIDFFPTIAELAGAKLSRRVRAQVEGRSLVPLLRNPTAPWPDRVLFTHTGRWESGQAAQSKYRNCSVRNGRWHLVCVSKSGEKQWQLFDVKADPGENNDVAALHPDVVKELDSAYDKWWDSVQPQLVNENAVGPKVNPFKELYWKQFGGGPDEETLRKMNPAEAGKPGKSKPNILFIAVDDLRPELSCYGNPIIKSPNIDRIARAGVVFNRAYCQQAVCSPSRSSLLTGTRPDTTKVWDLKTHFRKAQPDVVTLPQFFKNNGYFVQGMGKIYHGGYNDPPSWSVPWTTPKAEAYASAENKALVRKKRQKAIAEGKNEEGIQQAGKGPAYEGADVPDNTFHDGALADMAVTALREIKQKNQPFFLAVGFIRPHLPFVSPKKYWDLYDPAKIPLAPNPFRPKGAPGYAILEGGELRSYESIPHGHLADDLARRLKHGYYAAVSYMDAQVGRVLDELERLGLRDNTIIILWGDHGWKLGEHDAWCKHSNVENDTWAPLILSVPGMKNASQHTDALVEFVDIYPTLAELARLPLPDHLEGASFRPVLDDLNRPWKTAAFSQYPRPAGGKRLMGYTMRTDRYRFTAWMQRNDYSKADAIELYDHQTDPQENVNIANQPENAALVKELSAKLNAGWKAALPLRP